MTSVYRDQPSSRHPRQAELFVYLQPQHADHVCGAPAASSSVRFLYRANTHTQGENGSVSKGRYN